MGPELGIDRDRLTAGRGNFDDQLLIFEHLLQSLANTRLIVDDQNPMCHGRGFPMRVAPSGCTLMSRIPAGIRMGMDRRVVSPNARAINRGTASRGMGKSRIRNDRTVHSAAPGPVTAIGP